MELMVKTYMQRKVHCRNKSNDKYTKGNPRMISKIYTAYILQDNY